MLIRTDATSRKLLKTFDRVTSKVRPMARLPSQGIRGGFYQLIRGENMTCGFPPSARLIAARDLFRVPVPESLSGYAPAASCRITRKVAAASCLEEDALPTTTAPDAWAPTSRQGRKVWSQLDQNRRRIRNQENLLEAGLREK
jgi:hypothetical protein